MALAMIALIRPANLAAQTGLRVADDNGFFNFWEPTSLRPDVDYTQGLHIALTWSAPVPRLLRWLGHGSACTAVLAPAESCSRVGLGVGQDMYTPWYDRAPEGVADHPYAGWLYLRGEVREESDRRLDAFTLTVGMTGPPSLAADAQAAIHRLFGFRTIEGWDAQLPFEPGVIADYDGAREIFAPSTGGLTLRLVPRWSLRLGTIATDVTVGTDVMLGLAPPPPWQSPRRDESHRVALFLHGALQGTAVLRDEFLDGTLFSPSAHVAKKALVGVASAGFGIRIGRESLEWQMHDQTLTFTGQPEPHQFSTLMVTLQ